MQRSNLDEKNIESDFKEVFGTVRIKFFLLMLLPLAVCALPIYEWIKWVLLCLYFIVVPWFIYNPYGIECVDCYRFQTKFPARASLFILVPYVVFMNNEAVLSPLWFLKLFFLLLVITYSSHWFYENLLMKKDKQISSKNIRTFTTRISDKSGLDSKNPTIDFIDLNLHQNFYNISEVQNCGCEVNDVIEVKYQHFLLNKNGRNILGVKFLGKNDSFITDVQKLPNNNVDEDQDFFSSKRFFFLIFAPFIGASLFFSLAERLEWSVLDASSYSYLLLLFPIILISAFFLYPEYEKICGKYSPEHESVKVWLDFLLPRGAAISLVSALFCFSCVFIYDINCSSPKKEYLLPFETVKELVYRRNNSYYGLFAKFVHNGIPYKVEIRKGTRVEWYSDKDFSNKKIKVKFKKGFGNIDILDSFDFVE